MNTKGTLLSTLVLFTVTLARPVWSASDVLTLAPDNALAVVVVNRIGATSVKLEELAPLIKAPLPGIATWKKALGVEQGLDEQGSTMLVITARDGSIAMPRLAAVVPVSDYAKFVAPFGGDGSEEITRITIGGRQLLAGSKGSWAVLVDFDSRETLTRMLDSDRQVPEALVPLQQWLGDNDMAAAILPAGIRQGLDMAITGLDTAQKAFASQPALGTQAEQLAAALDIYRQLFRFCRDEINVAAVGIQVDDLDNIRIGTRWQFVPDGQLATLSTDGGAAPVKLVEDLPADDFVFLGGGIWSSELSDKMMQWSFGLMKSNRAMYGLTDASDVEIKNLLNTSMAAMEGVERMGFRMAPGRAGDPIYSDILFTMQMPDASHFLADYRKYIDTWNEMAGGAKGGLALKLEITETKIAGQKALRLTMDMGQLMAAQIKGNPAAAAQMQQLTGKLFGANGKLTTFLVQVDGSTIAGGIGSEAQITRAVKAKRGGSAGAAGSEVLAKTARLLPDQAGVACFVSPRGVVAWARRITATVLPPGDGPKIPVLPETEPVGFAARIGAGRIETETVVPAETLKAIGAYAASLRESKAAAR